MPVLKHAKKKLRQDKVRTARNKKLKDQFKKLIKEARVKKTQKAMGEAFSAIDKAAKNYILHKNTAARMKSSLSKVVEGKVSTASAPVKKAVKKVEKKVEETVAKATASVAKEVSSTANAKDKKKSAAKVEKAATKVAKKAAPKKK